MREAMFSLGDSWLVARTPDERQVAQALAALLGDKRGFDPAALKDVLDDAAQHRAIVVIPTGEGFTLVVPGLVEAKWLASLSAQLDTDVYAFEANDDYGLAIMLARRGQVVRDRYECPAEGIYRDEGVSLPDEPEELSLDEVTDFATRATIAPGVTPSAAVLVRRNER
jgi:hypothetical protein